MKEFQARSLPCVGVAVNQIHSCDQIELDAATALASVSANYKNRQPEVWERVMNKLSSAQERLRTLSLSERKLIDDLRDDMRQYQGLQLCEIPRLDSEVHDLSSLCTIGDYFL